MGRRLLLSLGLIVIASTGCTLEDRGPEAPDADPHGDLTCVDCHAGGLDGRTRAGVPQETCTASGCHADAGPRELNVGPVSFTHRDHGGDSVTVAMGCAGCHTHEDGRDPLVAGLDACSLCHISEQSAGEAGECRLCHGQPQHTAATSQDVELPHQGLPWMDGACVRCHYDVTEALLDVSTLTCGVCHAEVDEWVARGAGQDLHLSHTDVTCTACHEGENHRIQAMSSAVALECAQCHVQAHELEVASDFDDPASCNDCHGEVHRAQQRLLLGVVPGMAQARPSAKFMDGLTCRSCHVTAPGSATPATVRGNGDACTTCHRSEYDEVLDWWLQGARERQELVRRTLATARTRLGGAEAAVSALDEATALFELVEAGGAPHNLRLAHQLLDESLGAVARAYTQAGRTPPGLPDLGTEPSMGLCSYCHYRVNEPWLFQEMSGPFHESIGGG